MITIFITYRVDCYEAFALLPGAETTDEGDEEDEAVVQDADKLLSDGEPRSAFGERERRLLSSNCRRLRVSSSS